VRICILTQYYPPEMGAAQSRLSDLAVQMRRRGHEVVVLTTMPSYPHGRVLAGYGGLFRRDQREEGQILRTWSLASASRRPLPRILSYLSFTLSAAVTGALCLRRLDVVVTESPPLPLGVAGWFLSRMCRARLVFNVSDLWPESAVALGMLSPDGRATKLASKLEAFAYRRSWRVSGQTRGILDDITARFPRVKTIPLLGGVDTTRFDPALSSAETRARVLGPEPVIAIYAGLHGLAQGLDRVLEAAELLADVDGLAIVLVGDGPLKAELMAQAAARRLRNVRFVDAVDSESVPALLASADIAIVPLSEQLAGTILSGAVPSKLYEGMASGIPIVLVSEGEAVDVLAAAGGGVAVEPGDVDGLANVLRRLAASSSEREALGAAGRRAAVERHDRRVICDGFIDALERAD